ncbi:MAG: thioredoxin domain-containing protein [Bacteroidales bacterium]|nr:thioredoxin domain-containing protein [Bacteroidales bacterium]
MRNFILICIIVSLLACSDDKRQNNAIAYVDNEPITIAQIDRLIENDIYGHAISMYELRKSVIDSHIEYVVLSKEAQKQGMSVSQMFDTIANVANNAHDEYKRHIIDSLLNLHHVKVLLKEPLAPKVNLDSAFHIDVINISSTVTITLVADASCSSCHEVYPIVESLLEKYRGKVNYRYVNFSLSPTLYAKALLLADEKGKASSLLDTIMSSQVDYDSLRIMSLLSSYDIDPSLFETSQLGNDLEAIVNLNNAYISRKGVDKTPTILINDRPVRNPFDFDRISKLIDRALLDMR